MDFGLKEKIVVVTGGSSGIGFAIAKAFANEGPSFWTYAELYCDLHYRYFNNRKALDYGGASNLDELAKKLRETCMVRRLKKDVLPELPEKRRQLIVLESDADDSDLFPNLDDDSYFDVLDKLKADKVLFSVWSKRRHEQAMAKTAPARICRGNCST